MFEYLSDLSSGTKLVLGIIAFVCFGYLIVGKGKGGNGGSGSSTPPTNPPSGN